MDPLENLEATLKEAEAILTKAQTTYTESLISVIRLRVQKDLIFLSTGRLLGRDADILEIIKEEAKRRPI